MSIEQGVQWQSIFADRALLTVLIWALVALPRRRLLSLQLHLLLAGCLANFLLLLTTARVLGDAIFSPTLSAHALGFLPRVLSVAAFVNLALMRPVLAKGSAAIGTSQGTPAPGEPSSCPAAGR